jgi:hypothetical protein
LPVWAHDLVGMIDRQPTAAPGAGEERLERPAGSSAWRISAVVVGLLLIGVVALGRMGMDPPPAAVQPSPTAVGAASPSPVADASPAAPDASEQASPAPPTPGAVAPSEPGLPLASRYADGIPLSIAGERVLRLPTALAITPRSSFLVGGWYLGPDCGGLGHGGSCPHARLADSPDGFAQRGGSTDLTGVVDVGAGPRVIRAALQPTACVGSVCRQVLQAEEVVWSGDPLTDTSPIDVVPLMSALRFAFPDMEPAPYNDLPQCPVPWPPHAYRSTAGGPRMTLIFPTEQDRLDSQAAVRAGRSLLLAEQGGECRSQPGSFRRIGRWITEANVMLLVAGDDATRNMAEAALSDALEQSSGEGAPAASPISTWQAMRRLWRVEPTIDLAPSAERQVCGPDLPEDTFALRHPRVRLIAVFSSRAERRAFERSVDVSEIGWSMDGCQVTLRPEEDPAEPARWISHRNVLLEYAGPEWLAVSLEEALRGTGTP